MLFKAVWDIEMYKPNHILKWLTSRWISKRAPINMEQNVKEPQKWYKVQGGGKESFYLKRMENILGKKRHLVWVFSEKENFKMQKRRQGSKELKELLRKEQRGKEKKWSLQRNHKQFHGEDMCVYLHFHFKTMLTDIKIHHHYMT